MIHQQSGASGGRGIVATVIHAIAIALTGRSFSWWRNDKRLAVRAGGAVSRANGRTNKRPIMRRRRPF
jgi:hypothetical protein